LVRSTRNNFSAFLLYIGLSVGIFGRQVIWHPANWYVGGGPDPSQMMWFLVWWPYAALHGLNPFLTKVVWPPAGVNLAWMTPIPAPSLLASPVTYSLGPVVSYNLLALGAPALSAWSAYCLCAHVTRRFLPSFAGGYLYGFSSYEVGQVLGGHLGHSLVMLPPLVTLLFLRFLEGDLSHFRFKVLITGCLILQFLTSNALFATTSVFGLVTLILAWCLCGSALRSRLLHSVPSLLASYIFTAIAVSPYLFYVLAFGIPRNPIWPLDYYSADLVGFVLPNKLCHFYFSVFGLDTHFLFDPWENGAYLGVPLLLLCGWYYLENRTLPAGKLLAISLAAVLLAALGPRLHVAGRESVTLPWALAVRLPFIKHELPGRFMLFAFLIIAVMASIWLSAQTRFAPVRMALLLLSVLLLWPSVQSSPVRLPPFFTTGAYRRFLRRNQNVLVVPFGWNGESMLWQAQSLMYFRITGGYLGATPMEFERWPIVQALYSSILMPNYDLQLKDFLGHYGIETVLLEDSAKGTWRRVFSELDPSPVRIGGVAIYKVATEDLSGFRRTDAVQAQGRAHLDQFAEMIEAATQYLRRGLDPAMLTCGRAQELGLLPDRGESSDATNHSGWCHWMWLGPLGGENIGIGVVGYYQGLKPAIARYGQYTGNIFYPYPQKIAENPQPDQLGVLIMIFDRKQLAAAAAASNQVLRGPLARLAGSHKDKPASTLKKAAEIQPPRSLGQAPVQAGARAAVASSSTVSNIETGASAAPPRPVITAVNGTPVSPLENSHHDIGAPVVPARKGAWVSWWRAAEADDLVVIAGYGFDIHHGIAVNLYCSCPGGGVGPFLFEPRFHLFSATRIYLKVPERGANAPLSGPGSMVVSNKGGDGRYAAKSNRAPVWIGNRGR